MKTIPWDKVKVLHKVNEQRKVSKILIIINL